MKHCEDIGDNSATKFTVRHGFGTRDVIVSIYSNSTWKKVITDIRHISPDEVEIEFVKAPGHHEFRVVVLE